MSVTRDTLFGTQLRVLLCEHCGAPLEAALQGGRVQCGYCRATNEVRARFDHFDQAHATQLPEPERLARLRMQDQGPAPLPPSIASLAVGNVLLEHKLTEALDIFQATRREVKVTSGVEPSERLYSLAVLLATTAQLKGDFGRVRTVLETALDVVVLERHRTCLRAMLARQAVREGDLESAEQWLAGCNPRSDDLPSDSDYRVARALIDTARGNFPAVLWTLGRNNTEVPIADRLDAAASVLRANAYERSGDVQSAVQVLVDQMGRAGALGRRDIDAFAWTYSTLQLCAASLPRATAVFVKTRGSGRDGLQRVIVFIVAIVFIPNILIFLLLGGGTMLSGMMGGEPVAFFLGLVISGTAVVVLGGLWLASRILSKKGDVTAWLQQHGVPVLAQVRSFERTGLIINGRPQMRLSVAWISSQGMVEAAMITTEYGEGQLMPGTVVPIRVNPTSVSQFMVERD